MYKGHLQPIDEITGAEVEALKQSLGKVAERHRADPSMRNPPKYLNEPFDALLTKYLVQCLKQRIQLRHPAQTPKAKQGAIELFNGVAPTIIEEVVRLNVDPFIRAACMDRRPQVFHETPSLPASSRFLKLDRLDEKTISACRLLAQDRFRNINDFDLEGARRRRFQLNELVEMKTRGIANATLYAVNRTNWKAVTDSKIIPELG